MRTQTCPVLRGAGSLWGMAGPRPQGELFSDVAREGVVVINGRCVLRVDGEQRVLLAQGMPIAHFRAGDRMAEANAMVLLVEHGYAQQVEVARAFKCDVRSVRRFQRRYDEGGLPSLARVAGYPKGRPRQRGRDRRVEELKASGCSNRQIGRRLGISEKAVRKRLRRLGWSRPAVEAREQLPLVPPPPAAEGADPNLSGPPPPSVGTRRTATAEGADPNLSGPPPPALPTGSPAAAPTEEVPVTFDADPADRRWDRFFAYLGLLEDAAPLFRDGTAVPGAGVLLAVPDLLRTGVLDIARQVWGSGIAPAFYGLRTTMMTLLLMALLRVQRPEALKERSPTDLGRVLGLDRAPEVKTVRRKLSRLAALGGVETFGRLLAQRRVATHGHALGFLYIDGHVRIYYGKRRIPKTHAARIHAVAPATTDYWVNDEVGDPLFVVTARANAGVTAMLPAMLDEIRKLVGDRRVTVVFDRGGYSPKLWSQVLAAGFDILTYRKGRWRKAARRCFSERKAVLDGREVKYLLADQNVRVGGLRLRQVTRLQNGHQTPVLTSRGDLPAIEVAYRMFERWRQENFFKYLREEYLLDALIDYGIEPDDAAREVPNPKWAAADVKLKEVREDIAKLQRAALIASTAALFDDGSEQRLDLGEHDPAVRAAINRAVTLRGRRDRIPKRVPVGDITEGEVIKLATAKKHLSNVLKMVAYQAESELVRDVAPHYKRADQEGRTLIQAALASAADIKVADSDLLVTLAPLSSPHRSQAIARMCAQLNAAAAVFPGTRLRLRYAVAGVVPDAAPAP